jgi:FAD/FMN-containing dehydrogenase
VIDDGNPVWEDIEYESENDHEFEKRWKDDEKENNEGTWDDFNKKELTSTGFDRQKQAFLVRYSGLLQGLV